MAPSILTVSELNRLARSAIEQRLPLLWVSGEVSNLTRAPSGHVYFSLKDSAAQVRCVMFRGRAQLLPWRVENGQQVEAQALATLYEARGDFQLNVESLRRAGLGKLYEAFVQLRERLAAQGLFDAAAKRAVPRFPRRIGVVTSPTAAALRDVLAALSRRARHVPVIIYPTLVQGDGAAAQIAAAIATAGARAECDVLLVARGGGSLEDLWAFNDEAVARAIRACPLPVIAGIGHETDVSIADMAADLRAATPTAAAEFASAGWHAAAEEIAGLALALKQAMRQHMERRMQAIDLLAHGLVHPAEQLAHARQRLSHLATRIAANVSRGLHRRAADLAATRLRFVRLRPTTEAARSRLLRAGLGLRQATARLLAQRRAQLETLAAALTALSPAATLGRGYSIVRDAHGAIVRDGGTLNAGDALSLRFAKGGGEAVVITAVPD
ncbi:MAG: exodeoxyribonuclease VII large subunit [Rhodocyclaceae bacterium]|nr:exodeoxyribonuclease VII large subunit [Rhodocyclaceae bacterium]